MFARVSGDDFSTSIKAVLKNSGMAVNFHTENGRLYLQASGVIIYNAWIPLLECDEEGIDITVSLDASLQLVDVTKDVVIKQLGNVLSISQEGFSVAAQIAYTERIEDKSFSSDFDRKFEIADLRHCLKECQALDNIARGLSLSYSSITVSEGKAYVQYSNACYATAFNFPDMTVAVEALKTLSNFLKDVKGQVKYGLDLEHRVMYVQLSDRSVVAMAYSECNKKAVESAEMLKTELYDITTVNMETYYDDLSLVVQIYPKVLMQLSVCENGLSVFVDNISTQFKYGSTNKAIFTITLSSSQVLAACKIFSEGDVSIKKGINKICISREISKQTLVLAGTIF